MLRNYNHTFFNTKKFILDDPFFECTDIFFYGYSEKDKLEESIKYFCQIYKPKKFSIKYFTDEIKDSILKDTECLAWEKQAMNEYPFHRNSNLFTGMSAWKCRYHANEFKKEYEKENNFKYDLVYNLRTDWFVFENIDHKKAYEAKSNLNTVYVPRDTDHRSIHPSAVGDIVGFGSSNAMNKYYSLYLFAKHYKNSGVLGHSETVLGAHIKNQKLERKYCKRNVNREYPFSGSNWDHLYKNYSKKEFLDGMGIDEKYLLNLEKKPDLDFLNKVFYYLILRIKEITFVYYLLKFSSKFFKK